MRIAKDDLPVKLSAPGATARLKPGFGDASSYGTFSAEFFSLAAGTDLAPLFRGLEDDMCQSPHWGYLAKGVVKVRYGDGTIDMVQGGDLFYWPPGHTVKVDEDAELLMFSPAREHLEVLEHVKSRMEQ